MRARVKERLERIDDIRSRINRAVNLLSGYLSKLEPKDSAENQRNYVQKIKREIRTILNQVGRLSELCNKSSKSFIDKYSTIGTSYTMYQSSHTFYKKRRWIELWASNALTITTGLDIYKWPLDLKGGIKTKIGELFEVHFKGKTRRPL